jgi:hypothetical protein
MSFDLWIAEVSCKDSKRNKKIKFLFKFLKFELLEGFSDPSSVSKHFLFFN